MAEPDSATVSVVVAAVVNAMVAAVAAGPHLINKSDHYIFCGGN
jgi:hypothetical protein